MGNYGSGGVNVQRPTVQRRAREASKHQRRPRNRRAVVVVLVAAPGGGADEPGHGCVRTDCPPHVPAPHPRHLPDVQHHHVVALQIAFER